MVLLADDEDVQRVLPQILIVNERMRRDEADAMRLRLPPGVHLLRKKKAWTCGDTMLYMLRQLSAALLPFRSTCEFVLSADTYRPHMTKSVLQAMGARQLRYL